jgi:hypothetical protein
LLPTASTLESSRQFSALVKIGDYGFAGTNWALLGWSAIPGYSALGAKSLLNKQFSETYWLHPEFPRSVTLLDSGMKYFKRKVGVVD